MSQQTTEVTAKHVVLVPRWGGTGNDDYYPWLREQLAARSDAPQFEVIEHDSADSPTPQSWAAAIDPVLGAYSAAQLARSVLVGHSVGSHAILQAIARLPEDVCIGAVVIVAGWWDIDRATWDSFGIPWPDIQRWLDAKLDDQAVRSRTSRIAVLLSDNDPIPASPAEVTAAVYRQRLNATVHIVPERAHFNDAKETAVLTAIAEALAPDFDS